MKRHDDSISDRLRRMAATDELSVGRGRAEQIASRAMARVSSRPRLRSLAAAIAGTAFAVVSVTGLGAVADSAVPGDSLYPVDRAYEAVGRVIGRNADRTQETLQEAITLAQRGDRERAVVHVATELGSLVDSDASPDIPLGAPTADEDVDVPPQIEEPTAPVVTTPAAEAAGAAEPAQVPVDPATTPVVEASVEETGDPFLLALENALRATQAAAGTNDELAVAEADEAVRSVVKLAADSTEASSGTQTTQVAPGALAVPETTTTTTTVARGNGAPGNNTTTTTTTSVPSDSEEEPPGDGDTVGDDSGGSQEGSTGAGEPGETGDQSPGPIILPIP
jgi:hypothetical protein